MQPKRNNQLDNDVDLRLDEQFVKTLTKIQSKYVIFNRHSQIRIEKWVEKLLQCDENTLWRKSRNNYLNLLGEMVMSQKITGIFLRMPPQKDLPNLTETQCKRLLHQLKLAPKTFSKNYQITMKKIQQPCGDIASELATPNCQTDRLTSYQKIGQIETNHTSDENTQKKQGSRAKRTKECEQKVNLCKKILGLINRNEKILKKDKQFEQIIKIINEAQILKAKVVEEEQSGQLKVEEGIEINKVNLFQFGSPRGMTQMQYFQAALQL